MVLIEIHSYSKDHDEIVLSQWIKRHYALCLS